MSNITITDGGTVQLTINSNSESPNITINDTIPEPPKDGTIYGRQWFEGVYRWTESGSGGGGSSSFIGLLDTPNNYTNSSLKLVRVNTDSTALEFVAISSLTFNKSQVGLENVDNTSDADKPVSTAQQTAINSAITTHVGLADPHTQYLSTGESNTDFTRHYNYQLEGTISNATYYIIIPLAFNGTLTLIENIQSTSGSLSIEFKIGSTTVTLNSNLVNSVTSTPTTLTANSNNTFTKGQSLTAIITSSTAVNLFANFVITRTS